MRIGAAELGGPGSYEKCRWANAGGRGGGGGGCGDGGELLYSASTRGRGRTLQAKLRIVEGRGKVSRRSNPMSSAASGGGATFWQEKVGAIRRGPLLGGVGKRHAEGRRGRDPAL